MTTTRVPSEAELIELEKWVWYQSQSDYFRNDWRNVKPLHDDVAMDHFRALLDLARTVQTPEK